MKNGITESQAEGRALFDIIGEDMFRVRRIRDGLYLFKDFTVVKNTVYLRWHESMAGEWTREQAAHIASAMIALTGDHGIEIEPVEG